MTRKQNKSRLASSPFLVSLSVHWIRGSLYIVAILVVWYFVNPLMSSLMDLTGGRNAMISFALFVAFGPLVAGWLGSSVLTPLFRNWDNVKGVTKWEDRMVRELAPDDSRSFPVVLVPWPSKEVKTLAVLTDTYQSADGETQLASVYLPGTPNAGRGFLRVVPVDQLVYTDWAMRDLLQYHWSFGASGPQLFDDQEEP